MVNGRLQDWVESSDRGFSYGDGVFTSTPVRSGKALLLDRHLARLARDCSRLSIAFPDTAILAEEARQICREHGEAILKIQVTRGPGGRGYGLPDSPRPTRVLGVHACPRYDSRLHEDGISVRICKHRLGWNTALAGVKHMNRLEQILARAEWNDDSAQEGLMLDHAGSVVEGTMSNIFVARKGRLITPLLDRCGVAGVMRGLILEIAASLGIPAEQRCIELPELAEADEIFLTNAVIGLWPVSRIETFMFSVGPLTRRLARSLSEILTREMTD